VVVIDILCNSFNDFPLAGIGMMLERLNKCEKNFPGEKGARYASNPFGEEKVLLSSAIRCSKIAPWSHKLENLKS
jgi:hypothetical protein